MHGLVGGVDVIHYSLFELRHFKVPADLGEKNAKVNKEKKTKVQKKWFKQPHKVCEQKNAT